jgi:membrane protein implicated in regulation of membrane protease activity
MIVMSDIMDKVIDIALGATVLFLLFSTIVLTHFNAVYNTVVTGLSATTLQGLFLLVVVLALIGIGRRFIKK